MKQVHSVRKIKAKPEIMILHDLENIDNNRLEPKFSQYLRLGIT